MDEGEDEGEAHAVHKPERMEYKLLILLNLYHFFIKLKLNKCINLWVIYFLFI